MKAIVYENYGAPDQLELREVAAPIAQEGEVLVRIRAASVNASDWEFLQGKPLYTRMWGLRRPRVQILGSDIAGIVESCGKNVTRFQPGDKVFGDIMEHWGGFAESVAVPEAKLVRVPAGLSFEDAAALPQAALVALQGLQKGSISAGNHVLINGAGGGAGSFAIQLAKHFDARVTAVDSQEKQAFMRSLGADLVMDFRQEDFTRSGTRYDIILDFVANRPVRAYRRALATAGRCVVVGGTLPAILRTVTVGGLLSLTSKQQIGVLAAKPNHNMEQVLDLIDQSKLKPMIDQTFPLAEVPQALERLGLGAAKGKLVITL